MWTKSLVRNSRHPKARLTPTGIQAALGSVDICFRNLSSDGEGSGNRPPHLSSGDRRGRSDVGRGGQGRGRYMSKQEANFQQKFIDPAERGEWKNHAAGIHKQLGRKHKGHGVRGADVFTNDDEEEFETNKMEDEDDEVGLQRPSSLTRKSGSIAMNSPMQDLPQHERDMIDDFLKDYRVLISTDEPEKYYWNEREYDGEAEIQKAKLLESLHEQATRDEDGNLMVKVDDATFDMFDDSAVSSSTTTNTTEKKQIQQQDDFDAVFQFVPEMMQIEGLDKPPPPDYDRVLPLRLSGPTIYDFVESMMNHPSKYGEIRWEAPNEERDRQPYPKFPPNRLNPSLDFVTNHRRFIYVWGLPSYLVDGQAVDLENPLHCSEIQTLLGECFDVSTDQVSLASTSSAFIGFKDIDEQKFAVAVGPMEKSIFSPVAISRFTPDADFKELQEYATSLVRLDNLPLGLTPTLLAESLFPSNTEVGLFCGTLSPDRIVMLSPTSAIVAMDSSELADSAVFSSDLVKDRLIELGQHEIRFAKARRELVFTGTHGGPDGTEPLRKLGPRLIVDGDMPTKAFYTSHASTIFLRDLDPSVTKEGIATFFQPFCSVTRDVEGSTEFVTCRKGLQTGRAFVGFDELGEAEAALAALCQEKGRITGLGPNVVMADHVKERGQPNTKRPSRSSDELLDSLNNWQQFVDPADLQILLEHNISIESLDETFRTIRYHNTTFASMDQAMRSETLNPDKESGGMFKELVETYISTLKECISTPENPGAIYESLHFPDEPFSTEIFDDEPNRQEALRKRREVP